jgi:predicted ester cyclase
MSGRTPSRAFPEATIAAGSRAVIGIAEQSRGGRMAKESNADIVRRVEELWDTGKVDELDQYFADSFTSSSGPPGMPPTLDTAKMSHAMSMSAFPDRKTEIQDIFSSGDKVCVRIRTTGTNTGGLPPFGIEANNKPIDFEWISIYEVKKGKITGHWAVNDGIALLTQLGAFTRPPMPGQ